MGGGEYEDDESIPDDAVIWRRVHPDQTKVDGGKLIPSTAAFRDSSDSPMSAILAAECGGTDRALAGRTDHGLVAVTAGRLRELGQKIIRDPTDDEPAHVLIAGPKPRGGFQKQLVRSVQWVIFPADHRED